MLRLLLLIILACSNVYILPVKAQESSPLKAADSSTLNAIDRQLMLKLIDLARFNIHFHETANRHQPWRDWTYPICREAGTSLSLSNSILGLRSRAPGLDDPKRISRSGVINGDICGTMGGAIGGTASTFELVQNAMVHLHARSLGYSSHTSVVHVLQEVREIDQLRQRRAAMVEKLTKPNERRVRVLEAVLFHEIEEQLLFEFRKWNCNSRELNWRENVFYMMDAGQNFTGMTSAILGIESNYQPRFRGPAALTALISASGQTLSPIIAGASGIFIDKYQRRKLAKHFPLKKPELPADVSMESINSLRSGKESGEDIDLSHAAVLTSNALKLDQALHGEIRAIHNLRTIAQQQAITGPLIGLTNVARGILVTVADYGYPRNALLDNRLKFAGRISQAVGQSASILVTAGTKFLSVKKDTELRRQQSLPSQRFARRLKDLDDLEVMVRSDNFRIP